MSFCDNCCGTDGICKDDRPCEKPKVDRGLVKLDLPLTLSEAHKIIEQHDKCCKSCRSGCKKEKK